MREEITAQQAEELTGMARSYLIRLVKAGKIQGRKMGKSAWLLDKASVLEYDKKRRE